MAAKLTKSSAKKVSGGKHAPTLSAKSKKVPTSAAFANAAGNSLGSKKSKLGKATLSAKSGAGPWPSVIMPQKGAKSAAKKGGSGSF